VVAVSRCGKICGPTKQSSGITLMPNWYRCLHSALSVIIHKLNVSGHLLIWIFFSCLCMWNSCPKFVLKFYIRFISLKPTRQCFHTLRLVSMQILFCNIDMNLHMLQEQQNPCYAQIIALKSLAWREKLHDPFVHKESCHQVSMLLQLVINAYYHESSSGD
jgi:hypothetical protein